MYPRNASSPPPVNVGSVALTSDGTIQTTGVSVRVKTGTGSWGAGAGTLTCDVTSGTWDYVPTQGETNGETFQVTIYKTLCQPSSVTVVTTASPTAGYAAIDWGLISRPTTTVVLSGTTIKAVTDAVALPSFASINITGNITGNLSGSVGSVTGAVGSVTGNVGGSVASVTGAVGSVTGNVGGNVTGSVGSVASGVTVSTNNDKTGYSLSQAFPTNFASLVITAGGAVTVGTNNDKTGYSLTQAFPSNFSSLSISAGGVVSANVTQWNGGTLPTIGTSTLTAQQVWEYSGARTLSAFGFTVSANVTQWNSGALPTIPTASENADAVWDEVMSGHTTAGTYGGRIPRSDSSNVNVKITGSSHIAADVHELQPAVIEAQHFALGAIDANAVAADASSEIATAVRTELAVELSRIDVTVGSRLATIGYTAPPTATTVADAVLTRNVSNVEALAETTTLCTLVLAGVGKAITVGSVLNIYRTNGTTVHATKTLTTDPNADPVTGIS